MADPTPADDLKPPLILHVDDDEANRYAVSRSLLKAGFRVIEAASGTEALRMAAQKPDLIILDVRLPDISGFDVCRRLKNSAPTIYTPVLHLSASLVSSADKARGLDTGADGYLIRPVEPVELIATVNALLRNSRTEEALRQSEEKYRLAVESVKDYAIFTLDARGRVTSWNVGAERVMGFPQDQVIDQPFNLFFTPEDRAAGVPEAELRGAEQAGAAPDVRWHMRADGSRFFANGVTSAIRAPDGQLLGFTKVARDETDRRMAEQERQRLLEQEQAARTDAEAARETAEAANRLKDEFLATLSHELRTPLNAIVGWAGILRSKGVTQEDYAEGLEAIERNAKVQAQLIEDLLDVSRIISGKLRLEVMQVDPVAVIEAALSALQPAAQNKGVRLTQVLDPNAGPVTGDAARLQQVVWNLLSNAIKFTPRGGRVSVTLSRINSHVQIAVADTGRGIQPAFLPYVFDRFRQADASTTRQHGGLGIGLAIVRHLVELHGGTVGAHSAGENAGATFTVQLPLAVLHRIPEAQEAAPRPVPAASPVAAAQEEDCPEPDLAGVRVLAVDDEPDARALIRRILEACDIDVATAGSSDEAFELLKARRFDAVISDIGMPGKDGYDLIRRLRSLPTEQGGLTPAVALTAFARGDDRRQALLAGFQIHVPKPVDSTELLVVIASLTGRTHRHRTAE